MTEAQSESLPYTQTTPSTSSVRMVGVMGGIGLLTGLLIVATFEFTKPYIAENKARALEQAIFEVVSGANEKVSLVEDGDALKPLPPGEEAATPIFACYRDGQLVGIAIEAAGQGFQETIRLLYGYDPERQAIVGFKVLDSKETPGLGDKIGNDPTFLENFEVLDAALDPDTGAIANPIVLVKHGTKTKLYEIDGISGATISSRAVTSILRDSMAQMAPLIQRNLDALKQLEGQP